MTGARTLFQKIWDAHLVDAQPDGTCLLYIDRHLVHEVTSPQAFEGLRLTGRKVRRPDATLAVPDHNVPTSDRSQPIVDEISRLQVDTLTRNCEEFGVELFGMRDVRQGIVHVIGPEQGFTLPGTTIVCGDSHTSTHGAFGALAFGIGTSEVEHVLATQTLVQKQPKTMRISVDGELPVGCTAKDVILAIIGKIGTAGGTGYVVEYAGSVIRGLSMEGRMTICNMSIEAGARAGLIAPDEKTIQYFKGRPMAPKGAAWEQAAALVAHPALRRGCRLRHRDPPRRRHHRAAGDLGHLAPGRGADHRRGARPQGGHERGPPSGHGALAGIYGPEARHADGRGQGRHRVHRLLHQRPDRGPAGRGQLVEGKRVSPTVRAMIVPGSGLVKHQAEAEGLDEIFTAAGFEWREPGCSMCLGMNPDQLKPGERCASTSNRNFEGRQGKGGRTHLVSPAMAAAAALTGHLADVRKLS